MIDVPPDVAILSTIRPGVVYRFNEDSFSALVPHFFVVLNVDPINQQVALLVSASSRVQDRLYKRLIRNVPAETLVIVSPSECDFLKVESVFDCNSTVVHPVSDLVSKLQAHDLEIVKHTVSPDLLDKLQKGVLASPMVSPNEKDLLRD